jgi:FMN phosphatase YigB (HAD superfamily)
MKILIDFDDALFFTKAFKEDFIKIFKKFGVSDEQFHKSYKAYKTIKHKNISQYDPAKQIKILEDEAGIDGKALSKSLDNFLANTSRFVFKDVSPFLKSTKKENLYLISFGSARFQKMKMKGTKIMKYFKKVRVTDKLKSEAISGLLGKNKNVEFVFIDDRIDQIEPVKKAYPRCVTVLLRRKEGRYQHKKNGSADFEVKNLSEVNKILSSNFGYKA